MKNLFDNPLLLLVLVLIVVVVFGANKLPGAARSLGRSLRIFKSEVQQLHDDDDKKTKAEAPLEGKIVRDASSKRHHDQADGL